MMPENHKFQAVLFDLDGTLLDTIDDLADSMNQVLVQLGLKPYPVSRYFYFVGDGMETLAQRAILEQNGDLQLLNPCVLRMKESYSKTWNHKTKPYAGVSELLENLKERKIKTAVLSNKPHEFTAKVVDYYFQNHSFLFVEGQKQGIPKKPDPAAAIQIAKKMNCLPENFVYLGDTNTDMLTANQAGMYAVGALWGFRKADELLESGARALIKYPNELMQFF